MSFNTSPANIKSGNDTAPNGSYLTVVEAGEYVAYLEIIATSGAIRLSVGLETPADLTSIVIPDGGSYTFDRVVPTGKVAVSSATGADVSFGIMRA